jgi:hypothetical protein
MSLYPMTIKDASTLSEPNLLASGSMIIAPIDMTTIQMTQITLQQMSNTQDFGIRAWVSLYQDGIALGAGNYPLLKFGGLPIIIHTSAQTPPDECFPVLVEAGPYFLNILNLTNSSCYFGFSKTDLA